jgi:1-acyl-sn-glycerol-3-phosphate acyltransferase
MTYWLVKAVLTPILRFFYRVRVEGMEHLPSTGPVILASNHVSFSDSIFLPMVLKRRVTFVAKAEYFDDPKTAWFFRAVGQIPIRREGGSASENALAAARAVLEAGGVFAIYPEGTRSPDGRLYRGHTGVARLALACRAPIIPVAMIGTKEAQPIGQVVPNPFVPITIRLGRPLTYPHLHDRVDDRLALRGITDEVMYELRELSGQEYVPSYAKRHGAETAEAGAGRPVRIDPLPPPPVLAGVS